MKPTFASILAIFTATVSSLPTSQNAPASTQTATVSFSNDQTGAHAPVVAPLDGTIINLYNALTGTPVGVPVQVLASSVQLVQFPGTVNCVITNISGQVIGTLTAEHTYADLDGTSSAIPVNLAGATMQCSS
ncbi:uncharacterized protein PV09_09605 [Verruconis gallopava]|uniref:Uncharacterized protein n=1 Tax=Verruconis gallopava TaxID=253628 RepID=A0A0D2AI72_9PEZI|nr:uncharacterized protein PV09_09605 [Verruconis gallopava]KIV98613.1 hypothetical protein PV09_09605 [Verruconis gallopava]